MNLVNKYRCKSSSSPQIVLSFQSLLATSAWASLLFFSGSSSDSFSSFSKYNRQGKVDKMDKTKWYNSKEKQMRYQGYFSPTEWKHLKSSHVSQGCQAAQSLLIIERSIKAMCWGTVCTCDHLRATKPKPIAAFILRRNKYLQVFNRFDNASDNTLQWMGQTSFLSSLRVKMPVLTKTTAGAQMAPCLEEKHKHLPDPAPAMPTDSLNKTKPSFI